MIEWPALETVSGIEHQQGPEYPMTEVTTSHWRKPSQHLLQVIHIHQQGWDDDHQDLLLGSVRRHLAALASSPMWHKLGLTRNKY